MSKSTRRFKKNKKNRTFKRGGASEKLKSTEDSPKEKRQGIVDIIQNKISGVASSAATFAEDTGLRLVGLERIDKSKEEEEASKKVDDKIGKIGDAASGIISDVGNVVDKTGAALIENVNEVLGSSIVKETTEQAAEKTADIVKEGAETFNEALNDPEVKAELEESIEKAGEIGSVVIEASKEPIDKAVDVAANATQKATSAALSGAVKVGTDILAAVPFFGAVVDAGKMVNDISRAASAVVEAGSEATEVASDAFIETKENVEKGLKILEEKKKLGDEISSRTDKSIKEFENPVTEQAGGARKTRRRLLKHRAKSKRVRFAI